MDKAISNLNLFHDEMKSISADKRDIVEKQYENNNEGQIQERERDEIEDEKKEDEDEEVINNNNNENINNNNNMEEDEPDVKCHQDTNDTVLSNPNHVTNNFASIETMLHNNNNHSQSSKDSFYKDHNVYNSNNNANQVFNIDNHNGMQGKRSETCDQLSSKHYSIFRSNNQSDSVKWWHPHVYANPPKIPTPFFITNILGINNSNNCYEFTGSPSDRTDVKLDEPLNLCVKNKANKNSSNSSSFDIHGHVGRKPSLNSSFSSSLKLKGKLPCM